MLDPWIIDEIRKREQERRQTEEAHQQLPDEGAEPPHAVPSSGRSGAPERGVAVVDYRV